MKALFLSIPILLLCSCGKDYSCKASLNSEEKIFKCENCSKKAVEDYKKKITDAGWSTVECEK